MFKSYKYRLYPNKEQRIKIDHTMNICRLVYNLALETKMRAWESARKNLSAYDITYQIPELRKAYPWIAEVSSQSLYAAVNKLDIAFKGFYEGKGYPKFRSKKGRQSFQCQNDTRGIDWGKATLTIRKIRDIPIRVSRIFEGVAKTVTISRTATGKYYASVLVDTKAGLLHQPKSTLVGTTGIDVGIKNFVVTSDGKAFGPCQYLKKSLERLRVLQHRACRKNKGSKNRKKANLKSALLHEKITNQRNDYIHKITTELVRDNQADTFAIEDLSVVSMLKNGKLSLAISDASFGEFFRQMKYKCQWYGKNLIVIGRFAPSSKRCSDCGKINDSLTLSDREWTCACGAQHDRDLNAAKNIKYYGLLKHSGVGSSGEPVESSALVEAMKQEYVRNAGCPCRSI